MTRRGRFARLVALGWATLLLASPALGAFADARLTQQVADSRSHVEETSSARCPVVHPPDCGLCRHLTNVATVAPKLALFSAKFVAGVSTGAGHFVQAGGIVVVRWGRAPPLA